MNNMKNSIKREQSQACLNFAERKNFGLQAKYKILSLLVLLLTAATGAWATEPTVYQSQEIYLSSLKQGDIILNGVTLKSPLNDRINFVPNRYTYNGQVSSAEAEFAEFPQTTGNDCNIANLVTPIDENGQPGNAWVVTKVENVNDMYYKVYIAGIQYEYPDAIVVTTNAAEEGAAFTEASFQMPAFDATAEYELVRDMSVQMTTKVGDGEDGAEYRIRVKKNEQGEGYVPAEMDVQQVIALFKVHDAIENKDLAFSGDGAVCAISIYAADDNDLPTGTAISFANLEPGRYVAVATAADGSAYDGQTAASNVLVLFEGYPVEVPAGEYVTFYKDKALTLLETETEAALYTITGVGTETATAEQFDVIPASVPLLVKNNSNATKTILLIPTENAPLSFNYYGGFVGTLEATTIAASDASTNNYAFNGKQFVWVKNDLAVGANKAWLAIPVSTSNARTIRIVSGGEATGISGMSTKSGISGDWYDLNGRKLSKKPTKKGVYILNGKKVVVK